MRIAAVDPSAVVAFLPSDHYISDNGRFMAHIRSGLDLAHRRDLIILLGVEPESPEVEYGWIESTNRIAGSRGLFGVRRFWEKPNQLMAQVLMLRSCGRKLTHSLGVTLSNAKGPIRTRLIDIRKTTIPEHTKHVPKDFTYIGGPDFRSAVSRPAQNMMK